MSTKTFILLIPILFFISCSDEDDNNFIPSATEELVVEDFIWKSMNLWYFWQDSNPNLADNRFSSNDEYRAFLSSFSGPVDFFREGIMVDTDRFSRIYSDYDVLFDSRQGIFTTNGLEYVVGSTQNGNTIGVVRLVLPNSDASSKEIQRGEIFYAVNGETLSSDSNSNNLNLLRGDEITLGFADIVNDEVVPNGKEVELTRSEYTENPVYLYNVIETAGTKIGYLMYNGFTSTFENELNEAFGFFKSEGINDLVLDLRYNPGGSVGTSTALASMITGQFTGELYSRIRYNDKWQGYFSDETVSYHFTDRIDNTPINSLNLNRVYILTTERTASASELLINGLEPYIEVIQIGDVTVGKNQASITLLDDPRGNYASTLPYYAKSRSTANPLHRYALQPIVSRTENSAGFSSYEDGLQPNVLLIENALNYGVLGEQDEPLLAKAIEEITGVSSLKAIKNLKFFDFEYVTDSRMNLPSGNDMFID